MANTLLINKLTGGYFQFVLNGDTANAVRGIKNDLLAVGEQLHFKTGNGANIIKEQFIYPADLTIVASGTFTFSTVDEVWTKLIEIGYFDWINSGGSGTGASRFDDLLDTFKYTGKDGQVVIVNESQQKLQTVQLYNYRTFTDLEDTPDLLLANKMVATNEAGTALIFKNLPEDPVNYLNSIGFFDYNDLATQTTPISVTANTDTKLTNDTLGAYTNINYPPYGVSSLWDATTNRFNFTQLSIGDTIDVRIHLQVTTTTSNQTYKIGAKFGIGSASAFDNIIFTDQAKTAGVHEVSFVAPFYIGEANILNNPAELYINTDASATVKVDGWYIRVLRRNINIVNVETSVDDATTTVKGILRLAGDLSGTATNPTVPALADKALKTTTITINGETFDLSADREWTVSSNANWGGIGGVLSNQSDLQNALNAKANDNAVVKLTGDQTIANSKEFTGNIKSNLLFLKHNTNLGTTTGHTSFGGVENGISIRIQGNQLANLLLTNITSPQNFELPDVSGTIALLSHVALKQDTLVSGANIKTINGNSLLGSGNLSIAGLSTGSLEFNDTDKTVWNNGKGNIANNTSFGDSALKNNTIGFQNTAYGFESLQSNSTGSNNTANGFQSLQSNTTGNNNTANGFQSLLNNTTGSNNIANGLNALSANTTGSNNIAIGSASGILIANGTTPNLTGSNSVFLGTDTKPLADNQTNQIVIGHNATGHGSNSVTLGNSSILTTILRGNVGIGTTSPSEKLTVNGNISTYGNDSYINLGADKGGGALIKYNTNGNLDITPRTGSNTIFTSGNVGIGTTSPANKFQVIGGVLNVGLDVTYASKFSGNDTLKGVVIGFDDTNNVGHIGAIHNGVAWRNLILNYNGGNVGIGTASDNAGGANVKTHISGTDFGLGISVSAGGVQQNIRFVNGTTAVGSITTTGSTTTYNTVSDYRLKQDLQPIKGLDLVSQIKVYDYEWKSDETRAYGVLAHELQEVIPQAVNGEKDAEQMQGVDYSKLVPILVQAIQELKAEINVLKN